MTELPKQNHVILTGLIGILAAILTGTGEFLLHYSEAGNYADDGKYLFLLDVSVCRLNLGHFIGVLGAPLYLVGMWHIYLGLKPINQKLADNIASIGATIKITTAKGENYFAPYISSEGLCSDQHHN